MTEIIFIMLIITVIYIVPLVYWMKKAYEDVEGMLVLIGVMPFINFTVMLIDLVVNCSEYLIKKIKSRKNHD